MWYFIYFVIWIALIWIFPWLISCIAYLLGFIFNITSFPIELVNSFIYPVWAVVYCALYISFAYLFYEYVHHHIMNK